MSSVHLICCMVWMIFTECMLFGVVGFFFQAEDCIRDLVRSRGLGDVYKRQHAYWPAIPTAFPVTT